MPSEFQVVILVGSGHRLSPFTDDGQLPKALLPIANKPLIFYTLNWLENAGLNDILIVCSGKNSSRLSHSLKSYEGHAKIEFFSSEEDSGTVEALRLVKDSIKTDFLVVSGDLVADAPLHHFLDRHRLEQPRFTALFSEQQTSKESDMKKEDSFDVVAFDPKGVRLVFLANTADLDDNLSLPLGLFFSYPQLRIRTDYRDLHCYIFQKAMLELLLLEKKFYSIHGDLVPWILRKFPGESCGYVLPGGLACRVNSLPLYLDINRQMARNLSRVPVSVEIGPKTLVGNDTVVGESCKIGDKSSIKKSVIGNFCTIGVNAKITSCVIMDFVVIQDNVKLENVVVGIKGVIHDKCSLTHCEVGGGYIVPRETTSKNEVFVETKEYE